MRATSFRDVSLMAIVPDSECKTPTLIGPVSVGDAGVVGSTFAVVSAGFALSVLVSLFSHPAVAI
jgi:hypothetical protein